MIQIDSETICTLYSYFILFLCIFVSRRVKTTKLYVLRVCFFHRREKIVVNLPQNVIYIDVPLHRRRHKRMHYSYNTGPGCAVRAFPALRRTVVRHLISLADWAYWWWAFETMNFTFFLDTLRFDPSPC